MSLQSCATCGYALAIVDGTCRHCHPSATDFATHSRINGKALLIIGGLAVLVVILLYQAFFR